MKPVSCGTRADARLLSAIQSGQYSLDEIDPLHFDFRGAPFVAAEKIGQRIQIGKITIWLKRASIDQDYLLIEGCGGFMTPITTHQANWNIAKQSNSKVVLISINKLGVLNQVIALSTLAKFLKIPVSGVILMGKASRKADQSFRTNGNALRSIIPRIPVCEIPYFDGFCPTKSSVLTAERKIKKMLAVFFEAVHCIPVVRS